MKKDIKNHDSPGNSINVDIWLLFQELMHQAFVDIFVFQLKIYAHL